MGNYHMSADPLDAIDISQIAEAALSATQRHYLDGFCEALRERAYRRVKAALCLSVRMQVDYCSQVGIEQSVLERLVNTEQLALALEQGRSELALKLIQGGAPLAMLHTLLGMGKREFTAIRKALGMSLPVSRKQVDDDESARIYRQWEQMGNPTDVEGFLQLHAVSGQSIHVLWGLVQDWQQAHQQRGTASRRKATWA